MYDPRFMTSKSSIRTPATRARNPRDIVQLFLLVVWSLFEYNLGNELYVMLIILLLVILSIPRLQNFILIVVSILTIVLVRMPVLNTWIEIRESNINTFQSFKPSISQLFAPNSGRDALPRTVREMLSLLKEHQITEYRLSASFEADPFISQRIVESAWPIKKEPTSSYVFHPIQELNTLADCTEIDKRRDVALVFCR